MPESNGKKQLKACIELLLSYSLVKREGGQNRVWIHPVVHEWTWQHLTTSEKQRQTEHALNIIFKSIDQHSKEGNSEKKLVYARDILPDIEGCVKNVMDYLRDRPEFNQRSWKHFMGLRDFLQSRGIYSLSCVLAEMLKNEHEICLGHEHPDTLTSMNKLATLYQDQGKYADAEPLFKEALVGSQKALGLEHPDTHTSMNNLASLYHNQGKYADAEPLFKEALIRCQKTLGLEHPYTFTSMNNLAVLYHHQGKYANSEPLYKEALAGRRKTLGLEHPNTFTSMNDLALLHQDEGKYADAEPLLKEALAGRQKALGLEHPDTLTSMNNFALLYQHQGKYANA
jgi:tetratricopeptide (TPR) repeat protein